MTKPEPIEVRLGHLFNYPLPDAAARRMRGRVYAVSMGLPSPSPHRVWFRPPVLRSAVLALAATLVVAAVSIGGLRLLERVAYDAAAGYQLAFERGTPLDITVTTAAGELTLDRAYADMNRVVVAIMASDSAMEAGISLIDERGRSYLPLGGPGLSEIDGSSAFILSLNAPEPIEAGPLGFTLAGGESGATWTMDFTLPVQAGMTVSPGLRAEAQGISVTLEQLTISPTAIRIDLSNSELDPSMAWATTWSVRHDGEQVATGSPQVESYADDQLSRVLILDGGSENTSGTWSVVIGEFVGDNADGQTRIAGPWEFEVDLP